MRRLSVGCLAAVVLVLNVAAGTGAAIGDEIDAAASTARGGTCDRASAVEILAPPPCSSATMGTDPAPTRPAVPVPDPVPTGSGSDQDDQDRAELQGVVLTIGGVEIGQLTVIAGCVGLATVLTLGYRIATRGRRYG